MFDTTPLSGHEEFWVTHRDAVTQCLMTFEGHISVDGMRQLVEDRLLIDGTKVVQLSFIYLLLVKLI